MNLSAGYKSSLSCDGVSAMEAMADFDQEIFAEAEAMAELFGSDHDLDVDSCFLLSEDSFCDLLHWPEANSAAAAPPFAESEETFNEASKRKAGASSAPVPKKKIKKRTAMNVQSSNCYSSKDDSNGSGRRRAGRGKANDPQSLYARKRRERIYERLRILQNMVPNGTKVDISTMLEEAVQYVKFLQLQIKLLSSDELWMYAPIAYQGMSLGLDQKISGL